MRSLDKKIKGIGTEKLFVRERILASLLGK